MTDQVLIFDTTLRDGEQAPGFSMTPDGKLRLARAIAALRVDVIEAGFAAASPGDAQSITDIARQVEGPIICSLSRAHRGDILASATALRDAPRKRIHVFLGTSPLHREYKLHMSREEVLEAIRTSVAYAREFVDDVEFSPEDAIRTERDFLVEALSVAAAAGATTLNVPDTVGYTTPDEIGELFRYLGEQVERSAETIFSTHCHDDLGMAVANSLAAVRGGARQIECAVNGIGERAGNCALEDVVMALRTRADAFGVATAIDTTRIMSASRTLAQITNSPPPRNKSIVGANAFAHESGIHQHGILQNRETYEIMKPEDIGLQTDGIVLGKHSGRHALAARARELGHVLDGDALNAAFVAFKAVADEVGTVDTARLSAILAEQSSHKPQSLWKLNKVDIRAPVSATAWPVARVELEHGERGRVTDIASAPGALDAAFLAVSQVLGIAARVDSVDMQYLAAEKDVEGPAGQAATVLVEVTVDVSGEIFSGRARARDILPCCVSAYLDAVSNADAVRRLRSQQSSRVNQAA
ncbi:2-isopropylmalate synthase [Sphingomonas ginkgonis]|uniref:2-isopropylmalate synthase n=1 Tax=Sphingomonas ginkgonis TaxID=2315330 RepID=A0A3R9YJZ2_9SPHN|nr:2-isopropylmalate synthase [Sphingomonas ginkgonis]RST29480.1 2-isopropylmalate synthase [Sphingomonas ginkgonis]